MVRCKEIKKKSRKNMRLNGHAFAFPSNLEDKKDIESHVCIT